jgi:hypothetical protein
MADEKEQRPMLPDIEFKPLDKDEYGLPDIEYKPLDETSPHYYEEDDDHGNNGGALVVAFIVGLVVLIGCFIAYKFVWLPKKQQNQTEQQVDTKEEMKLISTTPEGCNVYQLKSKLIIICPDGYKASEVK